MKQKKLMSLLLVIVIVMSAFISESNFMTVSAATFEGSGTASDPYLIKTAADLANLPVNTVAYFKLTNDIDLQRVNWTPIGTTDTARFKGTLDGDGYAIRNLNVTKSNDAGLFGFTSGATIKNLKIEGNSTLSGSARIGSFVGNAQTGLTLINCSSNASINCTNSQIGGLVGKSVNGGYISQCSFTGTVNGGQCTGGIIGYIFGSSVSAYVIQQCYVTGAVSGGTTDTGGILGCANTIITIKECFTTGNISGYRTVGGIAGEVSVSGGNSYIQDCYSWSSVTGTGDYNIGGIVGVIGSALNDCTIQRCYSSGSINNAGHSTGGIVGHAQEEYIKNCAALNPRISQNTTLINGGYSTVARIVGRSYGGVTNNIGLDTTEVYLKGVKQTIPDANNSSDRNGSTVTLSQLNSKLKDSLGWDFTNIWAVEPSISEFPVLRFQVVAPTGIILSSAAETVTAGDSITLTAAVIPENATNKNVIWKSSDTSVALVSQAGKVTAVKEGTAIITARTADGNSTAVCVITVNPKFVESTGIVLSSASETVTAGDSITLAATVIPENATNKNVIWKSSDTLVALVSQNGEVTAVKAGTAIITVVTADGNSTAVCVINVNPKMECINVALNKNASSNSISGTNKASFAVDGSLDTRWGAKNWDAYVPVVYLDIDLEKEYDIHTIKINEFGNRITSYALEYWNGNEYVILRTGETVGTDFIYEFEAVTASKVRLAVMSTTGINGPSIYEFEVYACVQVEEEPQVTDTVNLALNAAAIGSTTSGSNSAGKAIDGNTETRWLATTADTEMTLTIDFGQEHTFNKIKIIEVYERVGDFRIQYYDGLQWLDIVSGNGIGADYEIRFPDVNASKVRLLVENKINNQGGPSISEFEIYNIIE